MRTDEHGEPCPETLGEYRDLCSAISETGTAVKFLDDKIEKSKEGREEKVLASDLQMRMLLAPMLYEDVQNRGAPAAPSGDKDENGYTAVERVNILGRMRAASNLFYGMAVNVGCHAFIEFTGLMNEFIKVCEEAERQGIPWVMANGHSDNLPFQQHHIDYLSEKLECIYGKRVKLTEETCGSDS